MQKPCNLFGILCVFNSLKPSKTPPKIDAKTSQNRAQDAPKSRFGGGPLKIRFWAPNFPLLGGASWGVLGASWGRLGRVLGPSWESWGVLGASWGRLETSWGRLGATFIANSTCKRFLIDFDCENGPSKPSKIIKFHWFYSIRRLFAVFKLRSILDAILMPT